MGYFLALVSAFFFGASNIFFRIGLKRSKITVDKQVGLFVTVLINNLINIVVLLIFYATQPFPKANLRGVAFFVVAGLLTTFLGRLLLFNTIQRVGASRATSLKITSPFFTVLVGVIFLKEIISLQGYLGIALVLAGVLFISRETSLNGNGKNSLTKAPGKDGEEVEKADFSKAKDANYVVIGIVLGVLTGLSFGIGNVFRKLGVTYYPYPIIGVAIASFTALICVFAIILWQGKLNLLPKVFRREVLESYIPGGICTSLGLYSFFYSLNVTPVSIANSIEAIEPMFVFMFSYMFFKKEEGVSLKVVISGLAIIMGVILIILG